MFLNAILLALREIRRNVLRSSLTILGIVIGVAAVITMVTIGEGATAQVQADISKLGTNLLQVFRGQGFGGGGARQAAPPFSVEDATAIEEQINGVAAVAPSSNSGAQAIYGNNNWSTQVTGTNDKFLQVRDWALTSGRNFSESEMRSGASVCILGTTVRRELFQNEDPVGATIRLNKLSCQVIGLLESKGQSGFGQDQDDIVIVPLRMLQRRMAGNSDVNSILVSARDGVSTEKVQSDIEALMRDRRKIRGGTTDNFNVRDLQEVASAFTSSTRVLTALLGAVAAVSLIVGGVGIMNIMLVAVTERTREIGLRMAVGARRSDVLYQFALEAVTLSLAGGVIGLLIGIGGAFLMSKLGGWPVAVAGWAAPLALGFSVMVGIGFGAYPAWRAAKLDPIEALRRE